MSTATTTRTRNCSSKQEIRSILLGRALLMLMSVCSAFPGLSASASASSPFLPSPGTTLSYIPIQCSAFLLHGRLSSIFLPSLPTSRRWSGLSFSPPPHIASSSNDSNPEKSSTTTTTSSSSSSSERDSGNRSSNQGGGRGPPPDQPTISFPGGGIFFYWQAGAVHYLQHHFDLTKARLVGASAGALTAALAGCEVDMPYAAERALSLSMEISLWERPLGLAGVWGDLVRKWLDELLPSDAAERCRARVELCVNRLEGKAMNRQAMPLIRQRVSDFKDRKEVLETCMASVHIPFFMDRKPFLRLGIKGLMMDGSFLLPPSELEEGGALVLDHNIDPAIGPRENGDFVQLATPEGIKDMMRIGYRYAKRMHEEGQLLCLASIAKKKPSSSSIPSIIPYMKL